MSNRFAPISLVLLSAALAGCGGDSASPPTAASSHLGHGSPSFSASSAGTEGALVAQVRQATARFHRIEVAFEEGYVQGSPCEATAAGGMGAHFRKNALIDGVIDPAYPEILQYEPQKNGEWRLVGIEFLIRASAWDAVNSGPPTFAGQTFEDRRAPGSAGPPFPNYGLHMWVWQNNPNGLFTPWNPTVNCDNA
jgi:hypothetical protein